MSLMIMFLLVALMPIVLFAIKVAAYIVVFPLTLLVIALKALVAWSFRKAMNAARPHST